MVSRPLNEFDDCDDFDGTQHLPDGINGAYHHKESASESQEQPHELETAQTIMRDAAKFVLHSQNLDAVVTICAKASNGEASVAVNIGQKTFDADLLKCIASELIRATQQIIDKEEESE